MTQEPAALGSTYRLQLYGIGFAGARRLVAYLAALGIETLYVSPVLAAVPGSRHGYDVIDPGRLDPALGTDEEYEALLDELAAHHMRLLIDIVPNHMAAQAANRWWWEVQRDGPGAAAAAVFDIDWTQHGGRVLVPTLSRPLAELEGTAERAGPAGQPELVLDGQRFPLSHGTPAEAPWAAVLEAQHFRPAYWRLSNQEGNYRRFFDIDGLVGVVVEDPAVFERTHGFLLALGQDERIAGWRVDHVDGLTDPRRYLDRLRAATAGRARAAVILVEKIVGRDEALPAGWATDGTTGYEFADRVGGLFVDPDGARALAALGQDLTGEAGSFADLAGDGKRQALATSFPAPLARLARLARAALDETAPGHDLSLSALSAALADLTVHLDVYRTYGGEDAMSPADTARLARAAAASTLPPEAGRARQLLLPLLGQPPAGPAVELVQRWQQLSGAVMAKGAEDTATYRYSGLLSHAEVGCDPDRAATDPVAFHRMVRRRRSHRASLNATSTHDSKRSEDARARLFTLSERSGEWATLVARWHRRLRSSVDGGAAPDAHDELVAYQSLFAVWPDGLSQLPRAVRLRVNAYVVKAAREAKRRTSWVDPDPRYERGLTSFVDRLCRDERFGREMARLLGRIGPAAATNALSMLVLKAVVPGVPDFYQGTELWDFSLTDPDNRRPVDFERHRALLAGLPPTDLAPGARARAAKALLAGWRDGRVKLSLTRALLQLRRAHPALFAEGSYQVLGTRGPSGAHVVGVARRRGGLWVMALVPRQTLSVVGPGRFALGPSAWGTTTVRLRAGMPAQFTDVLTGATIEAHRGGVALARCLAVLPVAVLVGGPAVGG
ncbi:MAG TPA: malto-oligosyltrehalose synthase [Acidimicrobiales bacterium]|jgi:malto-oligosyltrehalose synthase|nr:malto-oligosyltrehalose synthase [Acidimicrobiales bacterium]